MPNKLFKNTDVSQLGAGKNPTTPSCSEITKFEFFFFKKQNFFSRESLINIQNTDNNECLKWCLVRYLHPSGQNKGWTVEISGRLMFCLVEILS